jgi:predicted Zn finger-like uncharacterized protein
VYTQCPDCLTRFRVTAEALRVARGTVRCGRCHSAFDALSRLGDTLETIPSPVSPLAGPDQAEPIYASPAQLAAAAEYHFSADDIERVFVDARDWHQQFGTADMNVEAAGAAPDAEDQAGVLVEGGERIEDITMEGDRVSTERWANIDTGPIPTMQPEAEIDLDSTSRLEILRGLPESVLFDEEPMTLHSIEPGITAPPRLVTAAPEVEPSPPPAAAEPVASPEPAMAAEPEPVADTEPVTATPVGDLRPWRREDSFERSALESRPQADEEPSRNRWATLAWTAASLLLAVLLFGQITHRFRQDLVRHPLLGGPLQQVYDRLGLSLSPNWDPAAFEIRQWGAGSDRGQTGRLDVRASLTNRAPFAQPYPLLRLALEDRFGDSVAIRDFAPTDYLKDPARASRMLAAGEQSEAELLIVDPGPDAVGYRLDACLPGSDDRLRCARDDR